MTQQATLDYRNTLLPAENEPEAVFYGLSLTAWLRIAIVTVLMIATFRFNLVRLWLKTNPISGEPNWRHAICVPLIGLYYLIVHRDELLQTKVHTAWSGLGILILGILLFMYGIYPGQNDFVKDFGMVVALFGVVTLLCGWKMMKIAWFPIVFLVCAIPWPELVYSKVASPLQHLAAKVAVHVLLLSNVDAHNFGTKIIISAKGNVWRTLNVAEACAGLRSLMTFISVAGAIAFLSARPLWQKILITFSAIPVAIFCNVMRVTGQGLLDHYWSQELSEGFAHQFVGIVMLVPGFFLILFVGWLLDIVFIEVVDEKEARRNRVAVIKPTKPVEWTTPRNTTVEKTTGSVTASPVGNAGAPAKASPVKPVARPAVQQPAAAAGVARTVAATPAAAGISAAPKVAPAVGVAPRTVAGTAAGRAAPAVAAGNVAGVVTTPRPAQKPVAPLAPKTATPGSVPVKPNSPVTSPTPSATTSAINPPTAPTAPTAVRPAVRIAPPAVAKVPGVAAGSAAAAPIKRVMPTAQAGVQSSVTAPVVKPKPVVPPVVKPTETQEAT